MRAEVLEHLARKCRLEHGVGPEQMEPDVSGSEQIVHFVFRNRREQRDALEVATAHRFLDRAPRASVPGDHDTRLDGRRHELHRLEQQVDSVRHSDRPEVEENALRTTDAELRPDGRLPQLVDGSW